MAQKRAICSVCSQPMFTSRQAKCAPTCHDCRKNRHGTEYMYRKRKCRCEQCKSWYQEYRASRPPCSAEGCSQPVLGRDLCPSHYSAWYRKQRKFTVICPACKKEAQVSRKRDRHCSYKCGMDSVNAAKAGMSVEDWLNRPPPQKSPKWRQCDWCLQLHETNSKYCSDDCQEQSEHEKQAKKAKMDQSRLFRRSFEAGDFATFLSELKRRSVISKDGCWLWPKLKRGYPVCDWSGKRLQVHRLSLEAKHGKPLGTQHAHHKCATQSCVNPDHLQPVTHRDNVAEMMQRRSYLNRIAELEKAIFDLNPDHPVLNRIEVA